MKARHEWNGDMVGGGRFSHERCSMNNVSGMVMKVMALQLCNRVLWSVKGRCGVCSVACVHSAVWNR